MEKFDPTYTPEMFCQRHEFPEGVLNKKTKKKYPTQLTAMLDADNYKDLVIYTELKLPSTVSNKSLKDLYKERLLYLREKYDYLELSWGGGHDSTMILKVSEEINCPLDAVSFYCFGDPDKDRSGFNSEMGHNLHFVQGYKNKFPKTRIYPLDMNNMYRSTVNNHFDYKKWCYLTHGMLDDVCRISSDDFVAERQNSKGALITGNGWKNAVYNNNFKTWSLYLQDLEVNHPGSISDHVPTIRFYETPEIMLKLGTEIREWFTQNTPEYENLWTANSEWLHENIMYKDLNGKIFHDGKSSEYDLIWQEQPRFAWYTRDPKAPELYKEYFTFVEWLNNNLPKDVFRGQGGFLGNGLKSIKSAVIDF